MDQYKFWVPDPNIDKKILQLVIEESLEDIYINRLIEEFKWFDIVDKNVEITKDEIIETIINS